MKIFISLATLLLVTNVFSQTRRPDPSPRRPNPGMPSHMMKEKKVGTAVIDSRPSPEVIRVDSCQGRRDNLLESLTLKFVENDVDLKSVKVTYEDRNGGRTSFPVELRVRSGRYQEGQMVKVDIPGQKCVDSIMISANPIESRRPGHGPSRGPRKAVIEIFAKIK